MRAVPHPLEQLAASVQDAVTLVVVHDAWRLHPLAWIHRAEARRIAWELRRSGHAVRRSAFRHSTIADSLADRRILRLSDPVMLAAVEALSSARVPYVGPGFEAMKRCYDKYNASRLLAASGFTCPETELGTQADRIAFPVVLKPRWGSDSIGLRHFAHGPVPACKRNERYIVQRHIRGADITIGVLNGEAGAPLHVRIPDGALYTFTRKYVLRPRIVPVAEQRFAARVRVEALQIAATLGVDWAARIDFIHEPGTDMLYFLECDVAPLVGPGSAFDKSLRAAGLARSEQLERLFWKHPQG
jgi:D-alanine-D-alanine ligase-like ATP-grasp enzyme